MTRCRRLVSAGHRALFRRAGIGAAALLICALVALPAGVSVLKRSASAQSGPVSQAFAADDVVFNGPGSVELRPDAADRLQAVIRQAQQAQPPGTQCPVQVDLKVYAFSAATGSLAPDVLFSGALAAARKDAILAVLGGFGPSVQINAASDGGLVNMVFMSAQGATDKEPPKLNTSSTPPKGSKVKRGEQITVTMVARDDANVWQSGIKTIQLVADSEGGRFLVSENFPAAPPGCTAPPPPRRAEGTYEVPRDPPPVVRLTVLTEDHVGLKDTDVGLFPVLGDWYGTMTATLQGNIYNDTAIIDYAVSEAPDGTVTGSGRVTMSSRPATIPNCTVTREITPSTFDVEITGSREGDNLRLDVSRQGRSTWRYNYECQRGGGSGTGPPGVMPYNALVSFAGLAPHMRVRAQDGESSRNEWTNADMRSEAIITIYKVRQ